MTAAVLPHSHQSSPSLPGTWRLDGQRAVTLRPREDSVLRIAHGCVWVTFDGPHAGRRGDAGDQFLGAGDQLRVLAGQRMVLESLDRAAPAYFTWDFAAATQPERARVSCGDAVAQAWGDLQLALGLGLRAGWRLVAALAGLGAAALLPRPAPRRRAVA